MIQRIQTLWLALIIGLMIALAYLSDSMNPIQIIIPILIVVCSLIAIVSYKKRKIQLKWCYAVLGILIVYFVFIAIDLKSVCHLSLILKTTFPLLAIIFDLLAIRGIKKDEKLVRSLDRLR
jgi:peptidoglycan/LPS O-acetylase OafA/YrhL